MAKTMLNLDHNYFIIIYLIGKSLFFNKLHTANRKHISFRPWNHILNKTVFFQSYNNHRGLMVWPILKKFYSDHFTFLNFKDISNGWKVIPKRTKRKFYLKDTRTHAVQEPNCVLKGCSMWGKSNSDEFSCLKI